MFDVLLSNNILAALVAFALVLIPAVIIHELGHFVAARMVGITILEFGIGFPPRMVRLFTRGGVEFTLNWLPLGGFVRPLGEDFVSPKDEKSKVVSEDRLEAQRRGVTHLQSVNETRPWPRIFFFINGAVFNLISAFLLFMVMGLLGVPEVVGARFDVVEVAPDGALGQAGLQSGDIIESVNGRAFFTVEALIEALQSAPDGSPTHTVVVLRGEDGTPTSIAPAPLSSGDERVLAEGYVRLVGLVEDAPADSAGLRPGDLIVAFNGTPITATEALIAQTGQNLGQDVTLTVRRDGAEQQVTLVPRENPPAGEGAMGIVIAPAQPVPGAGLILQDAPPQQRVVSLNLPQAFSYASARFNEIMSAIVSLPGQLIGGTIQPEAARPVSIVGISQAGGLFLQQSIAQRTPVLIINFIAIISIALGLTNLLPLPALDGGRILFALIELLRGRPIAPEREGFVHLLGLALLLSITVLFVINDILNPITQLF